MTPAGGPWHAIETEPASAGAPTRAAVAAALAAVPAGATVPEAAAYVRAAVPFGVEVVGTTPTDIAAAFVAAGGNPGANGRLTAADRDRLAAVWRAYPWRVLPEVPLSPAVNVALDEVLTDAVGAGTGRPVARFWGWAAPAVVIGRSQSVANEVDPAAAGRAGFAVVRRMTGGGAMFCEPAGAVTYSLAVPEAAVAGLTVRQSYELCDGWVVAALRTLGVDAHYVPVNDIGWADGKIGGAAQARRRGAVLHHATLAYALDPAAMARVLRLNRDRVTARGTPSASKRVSPLTGQLDVPRPAVVTRLMTHFVATFGGTADTLGPAEVAAAEALAAAKYATPEWTAEFP